MRRKYFQAAERVLSSCCAAFDHESMQLFSIFKSWRVEKNSRAFGTFAVRQAPFSYMNLGFDLLNSRTPTTKDFLPDPRVEPAKLNFDLQSDPCTVAAHAQGR